MLVLTRKQNESISIGSNIVIRVIKTSKGSVRIGIEAPASVRILRGELATVEPELPAESLELNDVKEFSLNYEQEFNLNYGEELNECMLEAMLVQS